MRCWAHPPLLGSSSWLLPTCSWHLGGQPSSGLVTELNTLLHPYTLALLLLKTPPLAFHRAGVAPGPQQVFIQQTRENNPQGEGASVQAADTAPYPSWRQSQVQPHRSPSWGRRQMDPGGQVLQNKGNGRSNPAWIKKETTYFSFLRPRRPPKLHTCTMVPRGSEQGGGTRS